MYSKPTKLIVNRTPENSWTPQLNLAKKPALPDKVCPSYIILFFSTNQHYDTLSQHYNAMS